MSNSKTKKSSVSASSHNNNRGHAIKPDSTPHGNGKDSGIRKISLTLTFMSDWHVGEGAGSSGHIDRIVRRHPEDSLPYVPAKTLTGILRDGCEKIALGLDEGKEGGPWQQFLSAIFGQQSQDTDMSATTTHARLSIGSARFEPVLRSLLAESPELKAALTFVKPGIKVDESGVAESKMLRYEEVVLAGASLMAEAVLDVPEKSRQAALALLAAGAKAVERLGAKRRRGNGRCVLNIAQAPGRLADILGKTPPDLAPPHSRELELVTTTLLSNETGWHTINLDVELLSPVVIPADTAGNVISTRDYIPGSLLLPALDKKLRNLLGEQVAPSLSTLLARGLIQIRNAYLADGSQRLLPVPAALMSEKDNPGTVTNELHGQGEDKIQRKQLRADYTPLDGLPASSPNKSPLFTVKTIVATHAVVQDKTQCPTSEVGGVYTYEAIRAKQTFRAELWIAKSLLNTLHDVARLEGEVRIGRAKKDDYGRVNIIASASAANRANNQNATKFTLWLISPLLARDERLRPITNADAFAVWLGKKLNVEFTAVKSFVRSFRDDGWNNAWKEPRPTRFGLAAGSCFHFTATSEIDGKLLTALEIEGLGERRGEGYGELRVNAPILKQGELVRIEATKMPDTSANEQLLKKTEFTCQLHQRAWRIGIRRQAISSTEAFIRCLDWSAKKPVNSQLGALRSVFEVWGGTEADRTRLRNWLEHLRKIERRKDKWPDSTLKVLDDFAKNEDAVWSRINTGALPLLISHDREKLKNSMAAEAARILWLTTIAVRFDEQSDEKPDSTRKGEN